jgi:cobalt-zinc-cadmium efflux system outer membrane protein
VFTEATMRLDLEIRGQGVHRRAAAQAGLTRTEWEIATQELTVSVAASRAFNSVIYRQRKLEVLEDTIRFNEQVFDQVKKLVDLGRLRSADLVVARTELDAARAVLGQGKTALAVSRADLRRQFGTLNDSFEVKGELDQSIPITDFELYAKAALERRPDLQARRAMAEEAQARYRLQVADRFGNPSVGPGFEYNETSATFVGMWLVTPIPVLNTRRGEIMQAEATAARARAEVRQFEVQSAQDVQAALARLAEARKWVDNYTSGVLPNLRKAVDDMNKLLEQNDPGVDALRVIGVQRNYLRAFDAYLDALFELSQARADLAAAVGDPTLALGVPAPPVKPMPAPPVPPKKDQP